MRPLRIGFDVDGVLADFNRGLLTLLGEQTGRQLKPVDWQPTTWNYPTDIGYTKTETDAAWKTITEDRLWWYRLSAYPDTFKTLVQLSNLSGAGTIDLTFITSRPGDTARWQTIAWLYNHLIEKPQVLIASGANQKAMLSSYLELDAFVDDRIENVQAVELRGHCAIQNVLVDQAWNRHVEVAGVTRMAPADLASWVLNLATRR